MILKGVSWNFLEAFDVDKLNELRKQHHCCLKHLHSHTVGWIRLSNCLISSTCKWNFFSNELSRRFFRVKCQHVTFHLKERAQFASNQRKTYWQSFIAESASFNCFSAPPSLSHHHQLCYSFTPKCFTFSVFVWTFTFLVCTFQAVHKYPIVGCVEIYKFWVRKRFSLFA